MSLTRTYGYKTAPDKKKREIVRYDGGVVVSGGTDKPVNLGKKQMTLIDVICNMGLDSPKSPLKKSPPGKAVATPTRMSPPSDCWGPGVTSAFMM